MAKNTLPSRERPFTRDEIDDFFSKHLPYRLLLLRSWTERVRTKEGRRIPRLHISSVAFDNLTPQIGNFSDILNCGFEACLIASRMFLDFLGLSIRYSPDLTLVEDRNYLRTGKVSYEVKVIDLGGYFVTIDKEPLVKDNQALIAGTYNAGSKASAHLTFASNHYDPDQLHNASDIIYELMDQHLYKHLGKGIRP
jgi:hypothetical protein